MMTKNILFLLCMMAAFAGTAQVILADANGNVVYRGELTGADKDNFEACRCLNEDMPLFGITSFTEEEEEAENGAYVKAAGPIITWWMKMISPRGGLRLILNTW